MAGSGALVQWHDPGLNRMNVAAKTAGNYKTLCWLSRLRWLRKVRSSDARQQLSAAYHEFTWKRAAAHPFNVQLHRSGGLSTFSRASNQFIRGESRYLLQ